MLQELFACGVEQVRGNTLLAVGRAYYEADYRANLFPFIGTRTQKPVESRVEVTVGGVAPTDRFPIFVGEESMHLAFLDEARGGAPSLLLSLVCEVIEGAVTVRPVRIIRERDVVEEVEEVVS